MRLPTWPTFENGAQSERWEWLWKAADATRSLIFPQTANFTADQNRRYSVDSGATVTLPASAETKIGDAITLLTEGVVTIDAAAGQTIKLSQDGGTKTVFGSVTVTALAIPANDTADVTQAVAGLTADARFALSFNGSMPDGIILKQIRYTGFPVNLLELRFENLTAAPDTLDTVINFAAIMPVTTQTSTVAGTATSTAGSQFIKLVYTSANTWTAEYYTGTWTLA